MLHARCRPPIRPRRHRPYSSGSSRRHAGRSRRIRFAQASIADSESFPTPRAESPHLGPAYHRIVRVLPRRLVRSAIVVKPSSLLNFHRAMVHRKYRLLFSAKRGTRPGPKGPNSDLIRAVVEMKQRNPRWGCPRIAEQIALAFGIGINKDVVRRILAAHYQPPADRSGPSWLTLGHAKDSLHSFDLFRCESVALRTYWVLVVMDQYTRRIIGFGVHRGIVDGLGLCRMFNRAIRWQTVPKYLSSDHDPLYQFHQWQANLRVLGEWQRDEWGNTRKNSAGWLLSD